MTCPIDRLRRRLRPGAAAPRAGRVPRLDPHQVAILRGAQRGLAAGYLALFSRPVPDLHLRQVVQLRAVRPAWPLKRAPRDGSEDLVKERGGANYALN